MEGHDGRERQHCGCRPVYLMFWLPSFWITYTANVAVEQVGDLTPAGEAFVLLESDGVSGLLLSDGVSYLKLEASL